LDWNTHSVGFISEDHRYFVLNRSSELLQELDENSFFQTFPDWSGKKPSETLKEEENGSNVLLRASNGSEFKTQDANCLIAEELSDHKLWMHEKRITDHVDPCNSISAVEIVGDQLWLGTRSFGEYGEYPAEGVVIQSLQEGNLIKKIDSEVGLTGDLVRVIRIDPYRSNIWVATQQGFNEINRNLKIVNTQYFFEDFDGQQASRLSF
jgi:hypothetical protein